MFRGLNGYSFLAANRWNANSALIPGGLFILCVLLITIYVLDRYYERMLLISVLRASSLEAHYLEEFQIGLTTELEFNKDISTRASSNINLIYILMLASIILEFICIWLYTNLEFSYLVFMMLVVVSICFVANFVNKQLDQPNELIRLRRKIVTSPIIISKNEINISVERISKEIYEWFESAPGRELNVITILEGGRRFSESIVSQLLKNNDIKVNLRNLKIESKGQINPVDNPELIYGLLSPDSLSRNPTVIIDDLVDSGRTLDYVKKMVMDGSPSEIKVAVLINKYAENISMADFV